MLGLVGYGGVKAYMYYKAKQDIDMLLAPARLFMQVDYDRISTSVFGPVGIKGLEFRVPQIEEEVSVGEVLLEKFDQDGALTSGHVPSRIRFTMNDVRMNVSLLEKMEKFAEQQKQRSGIRTDDTPEVIRRLGYGALYNRLGDFRDLGYDQIVADMSIDLDFNQADKEATLILTHNMQDLGDMSLMMKMADMSSNINAAVLGVKLKEVKLVFTDDSYVERVFRMFAREKNTEADKLRQEVIAGLDEELASKQIKLNQDAVNNLKAFMNKPNKLIVTMYPFRPVGVESIKHYKPGDVPMLLNLQVYSE